MKETNVTIAVVAPQEPFEFFEHFWEGVWSAAHELAPLGIRVLTTSTTSADDSEQTRVLRELFAEPVQAIVLLPTHARRLDPLINQHVVRNTPVVTVFNDAPDSRRAAFVGPDFRLSGRLAGDLMAKMIPPKSHIVALTGSRDAPFLEERYGGFRDALQNSKVPLGLTEFSDPEHLAAVISGRGRKFDGLYIGCSGSMNIHGILEELRHPTRCVAFDLTDVVKPFLKSGLVSAVIDSNRYYQGYIAIQKAYECLETKLPGSPWVPIPSSVILPEHVSATGERSSLNSIFETLVRQRTLQLQTYKKALESANARLMHVAEVDPLTEVLNRRKFEERLEVEVESMQGSGALSLMIIDIDYFKSLNNLLGQTVGDQALKLIAARIRLACRTKDVLARMGDDEFSIILPETSLEAAALLRERFEAAIESARIQSHPDIRLSASIGISTLGGAAGTTAQLIEIAYENLNTLKRKRSRTGPRELSRTA